MGFREQEPLNPGRPAAKDAAGTPSPRGRATPENPPNRFVPIRYEPEADELEAQARAFPDGRQLATQVFEDAARSILNPIDSPDLPFRWTVNPYRGCEHGCSYCYARPDHERLGFSAGLDFETRILAKREAPRLLRQELRARRWRGETIALAGATDAWQPIEKTLAITRGCLEIMLEARQAVTLVTKNRLVTRDIDILREMARLGTVTTAISITTLDATIARRMEPRASAPAERLEAIKRLADAGIPAQVMVSPVIPGLTDHEIPSILQAAKEAGACSAGWILLRLPHGLKDLFSAFLERQFPDRKSKVLHAIGECRGGRLNDAEFSRRFRGAGARAETLATLFRVSAERLGFDLEHPRADETQFRPPLAMQAD
ncbi:MAG: PA0069 family radical SAM protein, partial [Planctomycetes bacterium]|nr:PA0069 family radical SAM protein [Planctomycetota bacterium]